MRACTPEPIYLSTYSILHTSPSSSRVGATENTSWNSRVWKPLTARAYATDMTPEGVLVKNSESRECRCVKICLG